MFGHGRDMALVEIAMSHDIVFLQGLYCPSLPDKKSVSVNQIGGPNPGQAIRDDRSCFKNRMLVTSRLSPMKNIYL